MANFYSQNDKRWKDIVIRKGLTIGVSGTNKPVGCFISYLAYPFSLFSKCDITPDVVLAYAKSQSLLDMNGNLYASIIERFTNGGLKYYNNDPGDAKYIFAKVKFGDSHFVGYRKSDNTVLDPWDGARKDAKKYFSKYPVIDWRYIK